ncbi:MAG: anti-sigma factor antagonist [Gammaproteobacteria bacterium HGW-Gammaproteobacteria-10]|uniref:Anti-sigma factor antagonist n=1 Tax=Methylotuvimicrobium buryatense TaxID=95641 RepID=A0A4P9UML6_METBY|nr:STAS domain-containing protein [Methylotuvimicrobium buryatense]PKM35826.1 MAG: anti-sigma factor antagonist [Gammaproteobacteria bacterium HGW-Gammaproteobacteria-10]QCW81683.1 anti-sigma factor antagonist [Methylotuvimicrobium buryatense]
MAIEVSEKNGITIIAIQDDMTIYTASEQKARLSKYLQSGRELQINLSGVSEMDSAGLQLLLWLKQEAGRNAIKLSLVRHSQAVVEVLELLNLTGHFGDPVVISANWNAS